MKKNTIFAIVTLVIVFTIMVFAGSLNKGADTVEVLTNNGFMTEDGIIYTSVNSGTEDNVYFESATIYNIETNEWECNIDMWSTADGIYVGSQCYYGNGIDTIYGTIIL